MSDGGMPTTRPSGPMRRYLAGKITAERYCEIVDRYVQITHRQSVGLFARKA